MKTSQSSKYSAQIKLVTHNPRYSLYIFRDSTFIWVAACLVLLFASSASAQNQLIDLDSYREIKISRLASDVPTAQASFVVDGGTTVRLHLRSTASNVTVNIHCPNGETLNSSNISTVNGTFTTYEIEDGPGGLMVTPELSSGVHYQFDFPNQGFGAYVVQLDGPPNNQNEIAVITNLTTNGTLRVKLITSETTVVQHKPISLALLLFDGQTPRTAATVTADILLPDGTAVQKTFVDNGVAEDHQSADGIYSAFFVPTQSGFHRVLARATGTAPSNYSLTASTLFLVNPYVARLTGNFDDFGVDSDDDGLLDKLVISNEVEVTQAGEYGVFVHLKASNDRYLVRRSRLQIDSIGVANVETHFDAESVRGFGVNGPYEIEKVELVKYSGEDGFDDLDSLQNVGQTQPYNLSQFQRPPIEFTGVNEFLPIDVNGNTKFDVLQIKTGLDVIRAGEYLFGGVLYDQNDQLIDSFDSRTTLAAGGNNISFVFSGREIFQHGQPGPYRLRNVFVREFVPTDGDEYTGAALSVDTLLETPAYDFNDFDGAMTAMAFTGTNSAVGIDVNSNGKYEILRVRTDFYADVAGSYAIAIALKDANGNVLQTLNAGRSLYAGISTLEFDFDGAPIATGAINGPLTIGNVVVTHNGTLSVPALFTTAPFSSNQFEIGLEFTGQNNSIEGIDTNSNGKFEALRFHTELSAFRAGAYNFQASLKDSQGQLVQRISRTVNLVSGITQVTVDFSGTFIRNANVDGPLSISDVVVSGMGRTLQVPLLFTTQSFNSNQFEASFEFAGGYSATGVDTNADGKFNLLRVQGNINVLLTGTYAVVVQLKDTNGNTITSSGLYFNFVSGINTFTLDLRGNDILRSGVNGPYRVSVQAWDHPAQVTTLEVDNLFETPAFSYTDFEMTFGFTGTNTATGIDTNANGKFETLRISSGILIERSGFYTVSVSLKDNTGSVIQTRNSNFSLSPGTTTLNFDFEGLAISNNGVDGPYTVGNISVSGADTLSLTTLFTTQSFTTDQFESGTVDLHFASYRLVPITGDGDPFLEPGENAELYIKLSNHNNGQARNTTSTLSTALTTVEVLSNGSFGTITPGVEKESTAFVVRLKPEAAYGTIIPFSLNVAYNTTLSTTKTFAVQTGKVNRILYNQGVGNRNQIYSMNSDGSGKTNLSNNLFNDYEPVSSPNGNKIAYSRIVNSTTSELWVMNSDGSGQQRLTDLYRFQWVDPTWSPDSGKIAFLTKVNNIVDLFVINADGTGLVRLTNTPGQESFVTWSTTNKIAYTTNFGEDIRVINPDGTGDTLIHDNPTNDLYIYDLAWSPDGSWIGWINERRVTQPTHYYAEVQIARPDGTEKRSLTLNTDAWRFTWSPDSARIAFVEVPGGSTPEKIRVVDIASGQVSDLSSFTNTGAYQFKVDISSGDPKWSRDGRSIAFVARETVSYPSFLSTYSVFAIDAMNGEINKLAPGNNGAAYKPEWDNLDRIPPASLLSTTPPANANGWNTSDVTVGITATDNPYGTGVQNLTYSSSGAQTISSTTITGASTSFNVFVEGVSSIAYSAKDNTNNVEDSKTFSVRIDKSLPISRHSLSSSGSEVSVTLTATDVVSGVSEIVYSVDGAASQNYSAPFVVSNSGGHIVSYFARDLAGNEETPRTVYINPASVAKSVLISEFRSRGQLGADDEFIELYNNSDVSVDIGGWSLSVKHGSVTTPIALATINSGVVLSARGHYLLRKAGASNYSLSSYAEADQTYSDSLGDNCGIKLVSSAGVTIDAVGFASVTDATYREGTGITPSAGITTSGQYSFARNFLKHLPVDSNNNKVDFVFVATDGGTFNNLKSVLGSPAPENLASVTYREGDVLITQIDPGVTLAEAPNRLFNYTNPPPQYPVGVLSVRRKLTNNSGQTISQLKLRITTITTKNSPVIFPQQAQLRLFNSGDISVTSADGQTTIPLRGLTVETVPTASDGGFNSSLTLDLGGNGLASGQSLNIDLKAGIVTNGQYKLEFRIETMKTGP